MYPANVAALVPLAVAQQRTPLAAPSVTAAVALNPAALARQDKLAVAVVWPTNVVPALAPHAPA